MVAPFLLTNRILTDSADRSRHLFFSLQLRMGQPPGELTVVEGTRKNSVLFIALLKALRDGYPTARRIHVVLDNFRIHTSQVSQMALAAFGGRIVLHFLPPYCPNENKIERLWQDLHSEVTRNHRCSTMNELMQNVWHFIQRKACRHRTRTISVAA